MSQPTRSHSLSTPSSAEQLYSNRESIRRSLTSRVETFSRSQSSGNRLTRGLSLLGPALARSRKAFARAWLLLFYDVSVYTFVIYGCIWNIFSEFLVCLILCGRVFLRWGWPINQKVDYFPSRTRTTSCCRTEQKWYDCPFFLMLPSFWLTIFTIL